MNVAIYLHPIKASTLDSDEDYLISSPELADYVRKLQPVTRAVLVPVADVRPLVETAEGEVGENLRASLDQLEDSHMIMLVKRPL